jgi:hypothetical protein
MTILRVGSQDDVGRLSAALREDGYMYHRQFSTCCQVLDAVDSPLQSQLREYMPHGSYHALYRETNSEVTHIFFGVFEHIDEIFTVCHLWIHPTLRGRGKGLRWLYGALDSISFPTMGFYLRANTTLESAPFWKHLGFDELVDGTMQHDDWWWLAGIRRKYASRKIPK